MYAEKEKTALRNRTRSDGNKKDKAHEAAVYISDDFDVTDKLRVHAGLRYSYFEQNIFMQLNLTLFF